MPVWKLDLVFECKGRGWEESYFADFGVPSFDLVGPIATTLATKRIALAAPPVQIKAYRVTDPLTSGKQGKVFYYKPPANAPANPLWGTGATDPSTSVNVAYTKSTTNQTRRIQMRGCPDTIFEQFGSLQGDAYAAWAQLFAVYEAFILGSPRFGWLSRPTVGPLRPVSYSLATNPILPVFTGPTGLFPADQVESKQYVRMSGFNGGSSELNRELIVYVLTQETFRPAAPIAVGPMVAAGWVQRYGTPTFVPADVLTVEKAGRRAPGAPLLHTPGRSRNKPRT